MDLVTVVVGGVVLVFTCLALYELFGRVKNNDAGVRGSDYENTELVADELPPTQTGVYRVRHMLASTKGQGGKDKASKDKLAEDELEKGNVKEVEEELPDPFA